MLTINNKTNRRNQNIAQNRSLKKKNGITMDYQDIFKIIENQEWIKNKWCWLASQTELKTIENKI